MVCWHFFFLLLLWSCLPSFPIDCNHWGVQAGSFAAILWAEKHGWMCPGITLGIPVQSWPFSSSWNDRELLWYKCLALVKQSKTVCSVVWCCIRLQFARDCSNLACDQSSSLTECSSFSAHFFHSPLGTLCVTGWLSSYFHPLCLLQVRATQSRKPRLRLD